jgi:hypothetical protein
MNAPNSAEGDKKPGATVYFTPAELTRNSSGANNKMQNTEPDKS